MNDKQQQGTLGPLLLSARKTQKRLELCHTTTWKMEKMGLLEPVNVYGKKYYTLKSIEEFERRPERGEFARGPRGAAAESQKKRAAKESA